GRGELHLVAGTGAKGNDGDGGPATKATFNGMHSLAAAPDGVIYLADTWNNRVRRLLGKAGTVQAFAGTGKKGFAGDGGPAAKPRGKSALSRGRGRRAPPATAARPATLCSAVRNISASTATAAS